MKHYWHRVTKLERCHVCGKPDYCTWSEIGACCMRIQSDKPLRNGGWLHPLNADRVKPVRHAPDPPPPAIDVASLLKKWTDHTCAACIRNLAVKLGVSEESLVALGCCWSPSHCAYGFPMFDGAGRPVGIRLRYPDGTKRTVTGTHNGLFAPKLAPMRPFLIVEGASDCAAALTLGFYAVGRPSCTAGLAQLSHWVRRLRIGRAVIVADNDEDRFKPDGQAYNPGIDGAQRLAQEIGIPVCLIIPPAKDLRASVAFGMTKELVNSMIQSAVWVVPEKKS